MRTTPTERLMSRIAQTNGCWIWTGRLNQDGYGWFSLNGRNRGAHVAAYELLVGPVPEGLELDHLCQNRACVNPAHLEPVTHAENVRRGAKAQQTTCVNGHPFDEANTYLRPSGHRGCRACNRAAVAAYKTRRRAVA